MFGKSQLLGNLIYIHGRGQQIVLRLLKQHISLQKNRGYSEILLEFVGDLGGIHVVFLCQCLQIHACCGSLGDIVKNIHKHHRNIRCKLGFF